MARKNFSVSTSRILIVIVAALIMLSAGAAATETSRRCFWCGPLAEQVHRSQRAPACGATLDHVTDCDPGFTHCAVVATSPPYVESRLCVKLYQDECYPLYCNSSKTWRVTCPCQEDLCNGHNTEREINAFSVLPKLVMKTKSTRINKRSHQTLPVQLIQNRNDKTLLITNISALDKNDEFIDNIDKNNLITEIVLSNVTQSDIVNGIENSSSFESTENGLAFSDTDKLFETGNIKMTVSDIDDNDITTEIETEALSKTIGPTDSVTSHTEVTHKLCTTVAKESKPSEKLPTAEALQQNASPIAITEKTTLPSTTPTETTLLTTLDHNIERTTEHAKAKNNDAITIKSYKFFWAISYCIIYIIC